MSSNAVTENEKRLSKGRGSVTFESPQSPSSTDVDSSVGFRTPKISPSDDVKKSSRWLNADRNTGNSGSGNYNQSQQQYGKTSGNTGSPKNGTNSRQSRITSTRNTTNSFMQRATGAGRSQSPQSNLKNIQDQALAGKLQNQKQQWWNSSETAKAIKRFSSNPAPSSQSKSKKGKQQYRKSTLSPNKVVRSATNTVASVITAKLSKSVLLSRFDKGNPYLVTNNDSGNQYDGRSNSPSPTPVDGEQRNVDSQSSDWHWLTGGATAIANPVRGSLQPPQQLQQGSDTQSKTLSDLNSLGIRGSMTLLKENESCGWNKRGSVRMPAQIPLEQILSHQWNNKSQTDNELQQQLESSGFINIQPPGGSSSSSELEQLQSENQGWTSSQQIDSNGGAVVVDDAGNTNNSPDKYYHGSSNGMSATASNRPLRRYSNYGQTLTWSSSSDNQWSSWAWGSIYGSQQLRRNSNWTNKMLNLRRNSNALASVNVNKAKSNLSHMAQNFYNQQLWQQQKPFGLIHTDLSKYINPMLIKDAEQIDNGEEDGISDLEEEWFRQAQSQSWMQWKMGSISQIASSQAIMSSMWQGSNQIRWSWSQNTNFLKAPKLQHSRNGSKDGSKLSSMQGSDIDLDTESDSLSDLSEDQMPGWSASVNRAVNRRGSGGRRGSLAANNDKKYADALLGVVDANQTQNSKWGLLRNKWEVLKDVVARKKQSPVGIARDLNLKLTLDNMKHKQKMSKLVNSQNSMRNSLSRTNQNWISLPWLKKYKVPSFEWSKHDYQLYLDEHVVNYSDFQPKGLHKYPPEEDVMQLYDQEDEVEYQYQKSDLSNLTYAQSTSRSRLSSPTNPERSLIYESHPWLKVRQSWVSKRLTEIKKGKMSIFVSADDWNYEDLTVEERQFFWERKQREAEERAKAARMIDYTLPALQQWEQLCEKGYVPPIDWQQLSVQAQGVKSLSQLNGNDTTVNNDVINSSSKRQSTKSKTNSNIQDMSNYNININTALWKKRLQLHEVNNSCNPPLAFPQALPENMQDMQVIHQRRNPDIIDEDTSFHKTTLGMNIKIQKLLLELDTEDKVTMLLQISQESDMAGGGQNGWGGWVPRATSTSTGFPNASQSMNGAGSTSTQQTNSANFFSQVQKYAGIEQQQSDSDDSDDDVYDSSGRSRNRRRASVIMGVDTADRELMAKRFELKRELMASYKNGGSSAALSKQQSGSSINKASTAEQLEKFQKDHSARMDQIRALMVDLVPKVSSIGGKFPGYEAILQETQYGTILAGDSSAMMGGLGSASAVDGDSGNMDRRKTIIGRKTQTSRKKAASGSQDQGEDYGKFGLSAKGGRSYISEWSLQRIAWQLMAESAERAAVKKALWMKLKDVSWIEEQWGKNNGNRKRYLKLHFEKENNHREKVRQRYSNMTVDGYNDGMAKYKAKIERARQRSEERWEEQQKWANMTPEQREKREKVKVWKKWITMLQVVKFMKAVKAKQDALEQQREQISRGPLPKVGERRGSSTKNQNSKKSSVGSLDFNGSQLGSKDQAGWQQSWNSTDQSWTNQVQSASSSKRRWTQSSSKKSASWGSWSGSGTGSGSGAELSNNSQTEDDAEYQKKTTLGAARYIISMVRYARNLKQRKQNAQWILSFLDQFKDRTYKLYYFGMQMLRYTKMMQRSFRSWKLNMRFVQRNVLDQWRKLEKPIVVEYLKAQDAAAKKLGLQLSSKPQNQAKRISLKDRVAVSMWMDVERKAFIDKELRYRRFMMLNLGILDQHCLAMQEYRTACSEWEQKRIMTLKILRQKYDEPKPVQPAYPSQIPSEKAMREMIIRARADASNYNKIPKRDPEIKRKLLEARKNKGSNKEESLQSKLERYFDNANLDPEIYADLVGKSQFEDEVKLLQRVQSDTFAKSQAALFAEIFQTGQQENGNGVNGNGVQGGGNANGNGSGLEN